MANGKPTTICRLVKDLPTYGLRKKQLELDLNSQLQGHRTAIVHKLTEPQRPVVILKVNGCTESRYMPFFENCMGLIAGV